MGASRFVGRVGGLAVALGLGAAVFAGCATASADRDGADRGGASVDHSSRNPSASRRPVSARSAPTARTATAPKAGRSQPPATLTSTRSPKRETLSADPVVSFADGVFYGQLNATSSRNLNLSYEVVGGTAGGSNGGKLSLGTNIYAPVVEQGFTLLPFRNWDNLGEGKGSEDWKVRVSEVTKFDTVVTGIPVAGLLAKPVISMLQQTPLVGALLAPLIGSSILVTVTADVAAWAPGRTPLSYTYKISSFDGTLISTNFFPAMGLGIGQTAPTVLNGPGLALPGETDPYATCRDCANNPEKTAVGFLRLNGYNGVTWDPRGEFDSGGVLQLDNPFAEGRDVSALIDWIASDTPAQLDDDGDPRIGMIGGSLGGGIQLSAASTDPRIEAITPDITWNSLNQSLYPSEIFRSAFASLLLLALVTTKARIDPQIYAGIITGDLFGRLGQTSQALLASSGPTALLANLNAPTLLTQGTVDALFPLNQSLANAQAIIANGTTAKVIWFCGGHGYCADPIGPDQADTIRQATMAWLNQYVARTSTDATAIPAFQWFDQLGDRYTAGMLPTDAGFNDLPRVAATSPGARLVIVPLVGGSGPGAGPFPVSLGGGAPARNAIDVPIVVAANTQVVGAPTLSFTYRGLGTGRAVFAQIIDNSTNLVLGQIVTPVPVTLDGVPRRVSVDLNDIVYTYGGTKPGSLTLQITSSATAFENFSFGSVDISDVFLTLPNRSVPTAQA